MLAERALALLMARMTDLELAQAPPAVWLRPAVGSLQILDFTHTSQGRMYCEQAALEQRAELEGLRDWGAGSATARAMIDDEENRES